MRYLYYPGCSLKSSGRAYEESLLPVFKALGVELQELDDWNCCGATAYMSVVERKAFALAARNLALAEKQGDDGPVHLIAPCSACFLVLTKTQKYLGVHKDLDANVRAGLDAVGLSLTDRVVVRHPVDVLVNDVGLDRIAKAVKVPLTGLRVASYYGCQMVRPFATFDSPYDPTSMDRIAKALGAEPVDWPLKTRCCGGSLTGTITEVGLRLNHLILREAIKRGANAMATSCPLCQMNLECYQKQIGKDFKEPVRLPVLFFTQLMGAAFGLPAREIGMKRLFVPFAHPARAAKGGGTAHA